MVKRDLIPIMNHTMDLFDMLNCISYDHIYREFNIIASGIFKEAMTLQEGTIHIQEYRAENIILNIYSEFLYSVYIMDPLEGLFLYH